MAFECSTGDQTITIGCTEVQLYSPKGSIHIEKLTDCSFNLDVKGTSTGLSVNMADGATTTVIGNGTSVNPVATEIKVSPNPDNKLQIIPGQGLYAEGITTSIARNGLSLADNSIIQLGNDMGQTSATLISNREIPLGGFDLVFSGVGNVGVGLPAGTLPTAKLDVLGTIRSSLLAGTGTRMVVADAGGTMSARPIVGMTSDNNFYVSKKYTGAGAAIVTGYTLASISSVNAEYTTQLVNAVRGSLENTYPDPWAARNAALDAIAAGQIITAYIVVLSGTGYTVGSDASGNNGTLVPPYSVAGHEVADVGFSAVNGGPVASLLQNNLYYEFRENAGLYYICAAYNIYLAYYRQSDFSDPLFKSSITGKGFFHRVYGEQQGFADMMLLLDNANAIVHFEARELSAGMPFCFSIANCAEFHCNIDYVYTAEAILFWIFCVRATTAYTKLSNISIKIREFVGGHKKSLYPDVESADWWTTFHIGVHLFPQVLNIEVENYTRYLDGREVIHFAFVSKDYPSGYLGTTNIQYIAGLICHIKYGNFKEIISEVPFKTDVSATVKIMAQSRNTSVSTTNSTNLCSNNNFLFEMRHGNLIATMLNGSCGAMLEGVNNVIILRFDKAIKDNVLSTLPMFDLSCYQGQNPLDRNHLIFEGWFEDKQQDIFYGIFQASTTGGYTRITLRGKFIARAAGKQVVSGVPDTNNKINYILDGVMLVNDGVTPIIGVWGGATPTHLCLSAVANSLPDASTTIMGNGMVYDSTVGTYY